MKNGSRWTSFNFVLAVLLGAFMAFYPMALEAEATQIKVGVAEGSSIMVSGTSMSIVGAKGARATLSGSYDAVVRGGGIAINGKTYASPVRITSNSPIGVGKVKYLGNIFLQIHNGSVIAVNDVELEDYLRGVLKMEVSHTWPAEVLKSQAIISRTYALRSLGKHSAKNFDICANECCQMYRGVNAHDANTDRAIAATKGQVLTFDNALASTFFHSDSGGATADVRDVWGGNSPYLMPQKEPFPSESKYATWEAVLSPAEVQSGLSKRGINVGSVSDIVVKKRDSMGRVVTLTVRGSSGSADISAHSFRMGMGSSVIRSTMFAMSGTSATGGSRSIRSSASSSSRPKVSASPLTSAQERELNTYLKQNRFNTTEIIDMLMNPEKRGLYLAMAKGEISSVPSGGSGGSKVSEAPLTYSSGDSIPTRGGKFVFSGRGWGHGVGMSQWGAKAMADNKWTARQILAHYYPGTKIQIRKQ